MTIKGRYQRYGELRVYKYLRPKTKYFQDNMYNSPTCLGFNSIHKIRITLKNCVILAIHPQIMTISINIH